MLGKTIGPAGALRGLWLAAWVLSGCTALSDFGGYAYLDGGDAPADGPEDAVAEGDATAPPDGSRDARPGPDATPTADGGPGDDGSERLCEQDTCLDMSTRLVCASDGQSQTEAPCPAQEPFCHEGTCVECLDGTQRCDYNQPQTCSGDNTWVADGPACDLPGSICEGGACRSSEPYELGFPDPLPTSSSLAGGTLYAIPFELDHKARVIEMGLQARSDGDNNVRMGIYGDNGDQPGTLLAITSPSEVGSGKVSWPPTGFTELEPGVYWVAALFDGLQTSWRNDTGTSGESMFVSFAYGSLPSDFPASATASSNQQNLFVQVQDTQ